MSRPLGFRMAPAVLERTRMCDTCTTTEAEGWIETFVADIPQSDMCLACARDAAAIVAEPTGPAFSGACDDCGRTFDRAAALGSHRRSHKTAVAV